MPHETARLMRAVGVLRPVEGAVCVLVGWYLPPLQRISDANAVVFKTLQAGGRVEAFQGTVGVGFEVCVGGAGVDRQQRSK